MTEKKASTCGFGPAGNDIVDTFEGKAGELGLELDRDDRVVLHNAARVADLIADLDADIAAHGVMLIGPSGSSKVNPAVAESRQQRVALARLLADVDKRLGIAAQGGSSGFRGTYSGDGSQNQRRDAERAQRRGRGQLATQRNLRRA